MSDTSDNNEEELVEEPVEVPDPPISKPPFTTATRANDIAN